MVWRALQLLHKFCREMGMSSEGFIQLLRVGHSATPMWKQKGPHHGGGGCGGSRCRMSQPQSVATGHLSPTRGSSFSVLPVDQDVRVQDSLTVAHTCREGTLPSDRRCREGLGPRFTEAVQEDGASDTGGGATPRDGSSPGADLLGERACPTVPQDVHSHI